MNLSNALMQNGTIDALAGELNIDRATAQRGAQALLPAIVAGLGRQTTHAAPDAGAGAGAGGLGAILGGLAGGGGGGGMGGLGGVLLDSVLGKQPTPTGPGNDILGQIFGNKDVSRGVAEEAAGSTGLPPELLKKMLPILVTAVVGYMLHRNAQGAGAGPAGGGLGGALGGAFGGGQGGAGGGALGGALGGLLGQVVAGMTRR